MTRRFARAPRGQRALGSVPFGGWHRLTIIGALSTAGMIAARSVEAPLNAALLRVDLDKVLVPELQRQKPDAVLVMDNLRPHRATAITKTLERAHLDLLYLPLAGALLRLTATALSDESARAALLARSLADRAGLVEGENAAPRRGGAHDRGS
jgi:hypothetical protein